MLNDYIDDSATMRLVESAMRHQRAFERVKASRTKSSNYNVTKHRQPRRKEEDKNESARRAFLKSDPFIKSDSVEPQSVSCNKCHKTIKLDGRPGRAYYPNFWNNHFCQGIRDVLEALDRDEPVGAFLLMRSLLTEGLTVDSRMMRLFPPGGDF